MKLKNIGNKLFTLFVLLVFVLGTIPLAFASEDENKSNSGLGIGLGAIANEEASAAVDIQIDTQIEAAVQTEVAAETNTEAASSFEARVKNCIARVTKNHPKADEARIEKFCRKHIELKMKINEKIGEKKEKIKEIKGDIKELDEKRKENLREFKQKLAEKNKDINEYRLRTLAKVAEKNEKIAKMAENLNEKGLEVYTHLSEKAKQWCNDNAEQCEKRIKNWKLEKAKDKRKIAKEKLDKIEERYIKAKEKFEDAEKKYKEQKDQFSEVKEKLKACKNDNPSEECKQLQQLAVEKAKRVVQHSIELLTNHLEKIKERINENENIADEEVTKITTEIDAQIKLLSELSARVEAAKTKDEIKSLAKGIQDIWRNYKHKAESHALNVANAKILGVVERSEKVEDKFQCVLNQLESEGKDTAEIDALVERYNTMITSARENYAKARESFKNAIELRTSKNLTSVEIEQVIKLNKEGKAEQDSAKAAVKNAHEVVKEIVKAIKENGGDLDSCSKAVDKELENEDVQEVVTENNVALDEEITAENKGD
ncbi:hypothetical protein J4232_00200 [Candidatus Woesearchaeota archaeon]|nr:hypothetical protein [Candidatus Woesearchaeota archaeon]